MPPYTVCNLGEFYVLRSSSTCDPLTDRSWMSCEVTAIELRLNLLARELASSIRSPVFRAHESGVNQRTERKLDNWKETHYI